MKQIILFLITITLFSCLKEETEQSSENNSNSYSYKIEYTSQLSDADLDLDITFFWEDENGELQSESSNIIDPEVYSELSGQKIITIQNLIGVEFKVNSGSNYLSDTYVKVTNLEDNSTYDVTKSEPIASTGGAYEHNTLKVSFNTNNNTFNSEYLTN